MIYSNELKILLREKFNKLTTIIIISFSKTFENQGKNNL